MWKSWRNVLFIILKGIETLGMFPHSSSYQRSCMPYHLMSKGFSQNTILEAGLHWSIFKSIETSTNVCSKSES